jgi:ankyrin repeat protein
LQSKLHGYQATSLDDSTAVELLTFLLKKNPESISVPDPDLPVKLAASCQGPQFCKCLIESLPNQDREEILETQELLLIACSMGLPETVQYFVQLFGPECLRIRSSAPVERAPIHAAVKNDHYSADITRMLLKLDPTLASFIMTATVFDFEHPGRFQVQHILPLHLHLGCSLPSMDVVQMLFDAHPGAILVSDPKGDDASTVIRGMILKLDGASKWKEKRIQKILDFVEKQKEYCTLAHSNDEHLTLPDEHGQLLLHKALADKDVSLGTIKMIFDKQNTAVRVADNDGFYPLHIASMHCTVDILCHVLGLDKSAVNKVDNEGNNILHAACKTGNLKVVEYIIDRHGSLATKANNKGQFPIVTLLDKDGKEGNVTEKAEYTGVIMKMLLAYPEFVVSAIECR